MTRPPPPPPPPTPLRRAEGHFEVVLGVGGRQCVVVEVGGGRRSEPGRRRPLPIAPTGREVLDVDVLWERHAKRERVQREREKDKEKRKIE